jgi:hypothetical protein
LPSRRSSAARGGRHLGRNARTVNVRCGSRPGSMVEYFKSSPGSDGRTGVGSARPHARNSRHRNHLWRN